MPNSAAQKKWGCPKNIRPVQKLNFPNRSIVVPHAEIPKRVRNDTVRRTCRTREPRVKSQIAADKLKAHDCVQAELRRDVRRDPRNLVNPAPVRAERDFFRDELAPAFRGGAVSLQRREERVPHLAGKLLVAEPVRAERAHSRRHEREGEFPVPDNAAAPLLLLLLRREIERAEIGKHTLPFVVAKKRDKLEPRLGPAHADCQMRTARGRPNAPTRGRTRSCSQKRA